MNPNRRFIYEILGMGLELGTVLPEDVLAEVTPEILAHHLPVTLKAKLLKASLEAEHVTPGLMIEVIGIEGLVENAPIKVLWKCIRTAVGRELGSGQTRSSRAVTAGEEETKVKNADDVVLKPAKSARPSRATGRVSSLSPRSRVVRGREDGSQDAPSGEARDFDVSEETDVLSAGGPSSGLPVDEQTRPGPKT